MFRKTFKAIPDINVDTNLLYQRIAKVSINETVTYEELSSIVGIQVQAGKNTKGYSILAKALKRASKENGMVFHSITNVGIKRLDPEASLEKSKGYVKKIRGRARTAASILARTDYASLSPEKQREHNVYASFYSTVYAAARKKTIKKLEQKIGLAKLSYEDTLKLFSNNTVKVKEDVQQ